MLNKKILATAVALACSTSAYAVVDLDDNNNSQLVSVAAESITAADVDSTGFVTVSNAGNDLDVVVESGFGTVTGEQSVVRFDLVNAEFGTNLALSVFENDGTTPVPNTSVTLVQGGTGTTSVLFEVSSSSDDIPQDAVFSLTADDYELLNNASSTISYALYEERAQAVAQTSALATESSEFTTIANVVTGTFTRPGVATATVASGFRSFVGPVQTASVGEIVPALVVTAGSIDIAGNPFTQANVVENPQVIKFAGDFSFGTWYLSSDNCTSQTAVLNVPTAGTSATSPSVNPLSAAVWDLCVTLDLNTAGDVAEKGSYEVTVQTLPTGEATNTIGQIQYNTTTVEVPYVTTFSSYNQRFYLVNRSARDALYDISFTTEDGTTATAGMDASGTVPAGEVLVLKATDVVTFAGTTRGAATIEIEAEDPSVSVATQSVNLSTGGTDTVVHND